MLVNINTNKVVISLGGSLIHPEEGPDIGFLKEFSALIEEELPRKFVIVCGGGTLARNYVKAANALAAPTNEELDWLGIRATHINAELVKAMLGEFTYDNIITEPNKKIRTSKKVIVAGGWKPGWSTDFIATLLAKNIGAKLIINLSNIDHVYTKDPRKYKNAKKIKEISWKDFIKKIVGTKWTPSANTPFDPIASKQAKKLGITVVVADGKNIENIKHILEKQEYFEGTVIHP